MSSHPKDSVQHCDVCSALEFNTKASHVCIQCQKLLCNGCMERHNTDALFTGHTMLAVKDVEGVTLHCRAHPQENVQMYCLTCREAVCVVCVLSVHDDHSKQSFADYVLGQKQVLAIKVKEAKVKHEEGLSLRTSIENKIAFCETDRQQAMKDINSNYDMLQSILETKKQYLLSELEKTTETRKTQLTEIKASLDERILNLNEHTSMARELISNDIKLIKACKSFVGNLEASFSLEDEDTEEALSSKKVRFIPSYDINLGMVNCSVPQTLQSYLDHWKDVPSDTSSSSLGFYDDSASSHLSLEEIVTEEQNKAEKLQSDMISPLSRPSAMPVIAKHVEASRKSTFSTGNVQPNIDPRIANVFQPKLLVSISYKNVSSKDVKSTEVYNTVPIGLAFKNEHKIYVTQWGIVTKSRDSSVQLYKQVKVGMVLYSLCSGDTCAEMCYTECSAWDVAVHQGLCYVTDCRTGIHTIRKYMEDGTSQGSWPTQIFYQPSGLAVCVDRVIVLDQRKQVRVFLEKRPNHPENVLKIGQKEVQMPKPAGVDFKQFVFTEPQFVTSNSKGWIIVSDTGGDSVHVFTEEGDHMFSIKHFKGNDSLRRPMGIATDSNNRIYVSDYGNDRVLRFDSSGTYSNEILNMPNYGISRPCGLTLYGNYLALSCHDQHNTPAVKIYDMGSILQPLQQSKCPCRWLRLCVGQENT